MIDRAIWERWRGLQEDGSPALLIQLIEIFLETTGPTIQQIETALAQDSAKNVAFQAHALKSSAASLGATRMADLCLQLEKAGRANDLTPAGALLTQLKNETEAVETELRTELLVLQST